MSNYVIKTDSERGIDRIINETDRCSVMFARMGGELIGYDVYDPLKKITLPLLWNNNNPEKPADGSWKNHATILFPIVGGLVDKQSRLGDYVIKTRGNHGFARHSLFTLAGQAASENSAEIHYLLELNDEIREYYPFDFLLELIYTLQRDMVTLAIKITNTDSREIFFSFGWHPGFNTELGVGGRKEDWKIIFPEGEYDSYEVDENCLLTGKIEKLRFSGPIEWDEKQLEGTILLAVDKTENRTCTLYNPKLKYGVKLDFADFPHFGLWSEVGKPFFCLEPWQGMDDHIEQKAFDQKVGIIGLEPADEITKRATIRPIINGNS